MEYRDNAPEYIKKMTTAVKSWLNHNDIEIRRKIKITNLSFKKTLQNERVPEPDELLELFNRANLRSGAIIALMSKSGLRPEVMANYNGTDGLTTKDLPDLAIVKGLATFTKTPSMIIVRPNLSKTGNQYFTFATKLGGQRILAYLNERILSGENFGPDSSIIAPNFKSVHYRGGIEKRFLTSRTISDDVRRTMRPRFNWRPYVLRSFFDTQLLISESKGKIAHDFRVFYMGHIGSIEATYTTNKRILPKALLDEMRESFNRCEEFLDLEGRPENQTEKTKDSIKENVDILTPEQLTQVQELVSSF